MYCYYNITQLKELFENNSYIKNRCGSDIMILINTLKIVYYDLNKLMTELSARLHETQMLQARIFFTTIQAFYAIYFLATIKY